jgi:tRNA G18 (ribose-2'-O)-methylase SpoU
METYTHEQRKALREADWSANVRDEFKGMSADSIKAELFLRRNNLKFAFVNAIRDFNFSSLIRTSNAFACNGIMYSGFRRFDPRGAVGTINYEDIQHYEESQFINTINFMRECAGYEFVVAESDQYDSSISLSDFQWKGCTILMLGEESVGVPSEYIEMADRIVSIPQMGSVRSLNVGVAAGILAYDYSVKTGRFDG